MSIVRNVPTLAILVALGGLGYYGHKTGWKVPRRHDPHDHGSREREDWCETHNVPDSKCLACHPVARDAKDWCKEHGVPESRCTVCHPELLTKGVANDYCAEHGVPESQCTACNPDVGVRTTPPAPLSSATVVAPTTSSEACQLHLVKVQFASPEAVHKAGVRLEAVVERPVLARVEAVGALDYDPTRVARVAPRVTGLVWSVERRLGDAVKKGDVLALIDSVEVGRAKGDLLLAIAQLDLRTKAAARVSGLANSAFKTESEREETEAALREARIRLLNAQQALANLGLPSDPATVGSAAMTNLLPLTAPLDGVIVARDAVLGEAVEPTRALFVVADTARMVVDASLRPDEVHRVALGQRVSFVPDGDHEDAVTGSVEWIGREVDERTRTVRVRATLANDEGRLRAHGFGRVRIVTRETPLAVVVPNEAIQWEGCCHVVFVRQTDDVFLTRKVRLGAKAGPCTEVLVGLVPGEVVATGGSHVLKRELLKSRLGAGCCD